MLDSWAKNRNLVDPDSAEFRVYLICYVLRYPEKATAEMLVAFALLFGEWYEE